MTTEATKLLEDAMKLSDAERADLASCLYASLEEGTKQWLDGAWDAEIKRRIQAIEQGAAKLPPWSDARRVIFQKSE
jgi:putative addiction module component (TIGR02574 family)